MAPSDNTPTPPPDVATPSGPAAPPGHADWAWDKRRAAQLGILTFARLCINTLLRIVYPFAPAFARGLGAVSYTHLTLPTSDLV